MSKLNLLGCSCLLTLSTVPVARMLSGRRVLLLGPAALQVLLSSNVAASTVVPVSPKMAMEVGGVAFAGTVTRISCERAAKGMIVTRVVLRRLEPIMGKVDVDSVVLRLAGGTVGSRRLSVPGQPAFEQSKRYILIAHKGLGTPEDLFLPIVGMHGGFFAVGSDRKTGIVSVHDWMHRPLVSASDDQILVEADQADSADVQVSRPTTDAVATVGRAMSLGKRVSEREFIALLRRLAKGK